MHNDNENTGGHDLVLEFNVDDMIPQRIPAFIEGLLEAGASDAFVTPIIMKKGRPGYLFTVTCCHRKEVSILVKIFDESSTIGVRKTNIEGITLTRKLYKTSTSLGEIQVKEITLPSGDKKIIPEYEECLQVSKKENIPVGIIHESLLTELNPERKI